MRTLAHSGWQVTSIDSTAYTVNAKGDTVYGARIMFTTHLGNQGSVFVEDGHLTPEQVTADINQKAATMDTIARLEQPAETVEL